MSRRPAPLPPGAPAAAPPRRPPAADPTAHRGPVSPMQSSDSQPWLFGKISRHEAEAILSANGATNGLFLVRQSASKKGAHALSLCWEGRLIHHLITLTSSGKYELNGKPCHKCTTLTEAVEYLRRPHYPPNPLLWNTPITNFPAGGINQQVPAAAPVAAQPTGEQLFKARLIFNAEVRRLGYTTDSPCFLKASTSAITLIDDETRCEAASWPLSTITGYGCDAAGFYFTASPGATHPGNFRLETNNSAEIITIIRDHIVLPESGSAAPPRPLGRSNTGREKASEPGPTPRFSSVKVGKAAEAAGAAIGDDPWAEIDQAARDIEEMCNNLSAGDGGGAAAAPPIPSKATEPRPPAKTPTADDAASKTEARPPAKIPGTEAEADAAAPPRPPVKAPREEPALPARPPAKIPTEEASAAPPQPPRPAKREEVAPPQPSRPATRKPMEVPSSDEPAQPPRPAKREPAPLPTTEEKKPAEEQEPAVVPPRPVKREEPAPAALPPRPAKREEEAETTKEETKEKPSPSKRAPVPLPGDAETPGNRAPAPLPSNTSSAATSPSKRAPAPLPTTSENSSSTDPGIEIAGSHTSPDASSDATTVLTTAENEEGSQIMVAGCDYDPQGAEGKMALYEGDVVAVINQESNGWWYVKKGLDEGWVPSDFLDPMEGTGGESTMITMEEFDAPEGSKAAAAEAPVAEEEPESPAKGEDKPAVKMRPKVAAKPKVAERMSVEWGQAKSLVAGALADMAAQMAGGIPGVKPLVVPKRKSQVEPDAASSAPAPAPRPKSMLPPGAVSIFPGARPAAQVPAPLTEEEEQPDFGRRESQYEAMNLREKLPKQQSKQAEYEVIDLDSDAIKTLQKVAEEQTKQQQQAAAAAQEQYTPITSPADDIQSEYVVSQHSSEVQPAKEEPKPAPAQVQRPQVKVREMSNEQRIQLMMLVKAGKFTIDEALKRADDYETGLIHDPLTLEEPKPPAHLQGGPQFAKRPPPIHPKTKEAIDDLLDGVDSTLQGRDTKEAAVTNMLEKSWERRQSHSKPN